MGLIRSGQLDRRIRIERAAIEDDGLQERAGAFAPIGMRWAMMVPGGGREMQAAMAREGMRLVRFFVRRDSLTATIMAGDQVRFPATDDGVPHDIKLVQEWQGKAGLELLCETVRDPA